MKIYNEQKAWELSENELDLEIGYLKADKLFLAHHEATEAKEAVYEDIVEKLPNGSVQVWKDLVTPAVEAKEAYDEYEDIEVYVLYTEEELKERTINKLRARRERECFIYVNRGAVWYDGLSAAQRRELDVWYKAWLDVTETLTSPQKPEWLQ